MNSSAGVPQGWVWHTKTGDPIKLRLKDDVNPGTNATLSLEPREAFSVEPQNPAREWTVTVVNPGALYVPGVGVPKRLAVSLTFEAQGCISVGIGDGTVSVSFNQVAPPHNPYDFDNMPVKFQIRATPEDALEQIDTSSEHPFCKLAGQFATFKRKPGSYATPVTVKLFLSVPGETQPYEFDAALPDYVPTAPTAGCGQPQAPIKAPDPVTPDASCLPEYETKLSKDKYKFAYLVIKESRRVVSGDSVDVNELVNLVNKLTYSGDEATIASTAAVVVKLDSHLAFCGVRGLAEFTDGDNGVPYLDSFGTLVRDEFEREYPTAVHRRGD